MLHLGDLQPTKNSYFFVEETRKRDPVAVSFPVEMWNRWTKEKKGNWKVEKGVMGYIHLFQVQDKISAEKN